jgi:hypothetical protein
VFNSQVIAKYFEQYQSGTSISTTFNGVQSFTAPRSVRLSAEFNHKF